MKESTSDIDSNYCHRLNQEEDIMSEEQPKEDFTAGFSYAVRDGEMILDFYCDCCGKKVHNKRKLTEEQLASENKHTVFVAIKKELDDQFHRCSACGFLICSECWDKKDLKCKDCPTCSEE